MKKMKKQHKEGYVLAAVMILLVIMGTLGLAGLTHARIAASGAIRLSKEYQASMLAEMGFNEIHAILMHEKNRRMFDWLGILSNGAIPTLEKDVEDEDGLDLGSYRVFITDADDDPDAPELADYKIVSIGVSPGETHTFATTAYIRLTTVSKYAWGTNTEGGVMFTTGDNIYFPVMSNGNFIFGGKPVMWGHVETGASYNVIDGRKSSATPSEIFRKGASFGAPSISFDEDLLESIADQSSVVVNDNCIIELLPDGKYSIVKEEEIITESELYRYGVTTGRGRRKRTRYYTTEDKDKIPSGASNITSTTIQKKEIKEVSMGTNSIDSIGQSGYDTDNIIFVNGTATVRGEVGGAVSVASADSIIIDEHIIYSSKVNDPDPRNWAEGDEPDPSERLGLYALNKVMLSNQTGRDANVHAAIFVISPEDRSTSTYIRGFCVEDYFERIGLPEINLYGSIVQNTRGAVGQGSGGYLKNYHQDIRFITMPPPGSPLSVPEFFGWKSTKVNTDKVIL